MEATLYNRRSESARVRHEETVEHPPSHPSSSQQDGTQSFNANLRPMASEPRLHALLESPSLCS